MIRPREFEYTSHVSYARALEEYCTSLEQRQPLTDEEIETIGNKVANMPLVGVVPNFRTRFARAIEAKLRGNT